MTNETTVRSVSVTTAGDRMGTPGVRLAVRKGIDRIFVGGDQARELGRGDQPTEAPGLRESGQGSNRSLIGPSRSVGGGESNLGEPEEREAIDRGDGVDTDTGDAEREDS